MNTDRKVQIVFDENTIATHAVIPAPGEGAHIEIDHYTLLPSGGANTLTLDTGDDAFPYVLDDGQALVFDNASGLYPLKVDNNVAFTIALTAATRVTGMILARIVGES